MPRPASRDRAHSSIGLVALWLGVLLLVAGPSLRGGYRIAPTLILELIAFAVLCALAVHAAASPAAPVQRPFNAALDLVLTSPVWLALVQLTPMPGTWWANLAGRSDFAVSLSQIGLGEDSWRALSLSPDATLASLLAGAPLVAAFLVGQRSSLPELRTLLRAVVVIAFVEVLLGLLQFSGGQHSPFYFGHMTYGSPIGSLPTRNLYANYLALALAAYIWLAYDAVRYSMRLQAGAPMTTGVFDLRHAIAAWAAGGLVLLLGALMSKSRAGAVLAIGVTLAGLGLAGLRVFGWSRSWRFTVPLAVVVIGVAAWLVGLESLTARVSGAQLAGSADFRWSLAASSFQAALGYFPWGSGWGTYEMAYPRFQPPSMAFTIDFAHMDYVQMFVEGGAFFLVIAAAAAWLLGKRTAVLLRWAIDRQTLSREAMAATLCGVGLFGFLLHAAFDFPMRIPANAMLAALLAGAFLRTIPEEPPPTTDPAERKAP